jgi:hypothetical protein
VNLWEKTKEITRTSAAIVSEKTRDVVKASMSVTHGGVRTHAKSIMDSSDMSRLAAEVDQLRRAIAIRLTTLGGDVYLLYASGKQESLEPVIKSQVEELEQLRDELDRKEKALGGVQEK